MGWSSGVNSEGRTIGYGHEGVCEQPGCGATIDLGLAYCCGELAGVDGERGCGHYFCDEHLTYMAGGQRCVGCAELIDAEVVRIAAEEDVDPESAQIEDWAESNLYESGTLHARYQA